MNNIIINILKMSLFSSIIIFLLLFVKKLFGKKLNIKIIIFMWVIVLAKLIIPFTINSPINIGNILLNEVSEASNTQGTTSNSTNDNQQNYGMYDTFEKPLSYGYMLENSYSENMTEYTSDTQVKQEESISWIKKTIDYLAGGSIWTYIFIIWITGASAFLIINIFRMIIFARKATKKKRPLRYRVRSILEKNIKKLGIKRDVEIVIGSYIDMPITFGIIRPKILIPHKIANTLSYDKIDLIIKHELGHIKRQDIFKTYLWMMAKAIHWFNPLITVAFRIYQNDIEFACDYTVTRKLDMQKRIEYSQSLIDVIKITQYSTKAPLAVHFCKDKLKLEERIMNMIKPQKKSKSAGFAAILLTIIMITGCFTTACQPTPEELVVQNKDKEELMEAIQAEEETSPTENSTAIDAQIQETQDVSIEHWTQTVNSGKGTVEINIDADIITPVYEQLPVVSLTQKTFSDSELANIVTALVGDREVYEYVYGMTRADIDEQIIKTKMQMTDLSSDMASSAGVETLEELAEIGNQELERLEALRQSAPESIERNVVDKNNLSQLGNEYICLQTDFDKGAPADLIIVNNTDIESSISVILNNTGNMDDHIDNMFFSSESEGSSTLKISKQEVESIAYELLNKLPAESMDISNVEYGFLSKGYGAKKLCYMVSVSRCVNGVYTPNILSNDSSMESETSARPVKPEYMNIYIDDSGIIGFFWSSPMETQEIINENVQTLDFEEIKEYFVQQFLNKYSYEISDSIEYVRYDITEITLNLARIKMPDNHDTYMLVPVWDFFGERCVKYSDSSLLEREKESLRLFEEDGGIQVGQIVSINDNNERVERFVGTSYMTINALNGASINRNLGY